MTLDVGIRVSGVDFEDPEVGTVIAQNHPYILVSGDQPCVITFEVDEDRPVAAAVERVRALQSDLPDLKVHGVDRDLVNTSDIATRVGVSREGARKMVMSPGFPEAFDRVKASSMRLWSWTDVAGWLQDVRGFDLDEHLPDSKVLTHLENCLMHNPDNTVIQWHNIVAAAQKASVPVRVSNVFSPIVGRPAAGVRAQRTAASAGGFVDATAGDTRISRDAELVGCR